MARITKEEANRIIEILSRAIDRKISERFGEHPKINGVEFEKRYMKVGYGGDRFIDHKLFRLYLKLVSPLTAVNDGEDGNVLVFKDGESQWVDPEEMGMKMKIEFPGGGVLPETGEPFTLYFIPAEDPSSDNDYDEYLYVNDKWERIGSLDLSDYYTKSEVDAELEKLSRIYDHNTKGALVRNYDGTEFIESTDSGMAQMNYSHQGHEHPAIQINSDTLKVKDTEGVVRIEVNESGVRLKGAPNDYHSGVYSDTSEPEITLNKDNEGGVTIKGGGDTNFVLKPDRALLNSHGNGLGYKYGSDINKDQMLQIDLGSEPVIKAVTRLENAGVVDREENISVKTPNTVRGTHENIMQANGRRYILYHPGGTAQMLHSNPSGTDKNGNVTGKVFFLDSYHDGGNRLLEVTDEGDRTQGQIESHRVDLRCPGTEDNDGLSIYRGYNPSEDIESHSLRMKVHGSDVLFASKSYGAQIINDAMMHVRVDGEDVVMGRIMRDNNGNEVSKYVKITAAGEHDVLYGAYTMDPNTGNIVRETSVMTDGIRILAGRMEVPTNGDQVYATTLMNPLEAAVLRAEREESAHTTLSVSMENNGNGQLLEASYDLDDEQKHLSLKNNGNDVLVSNYLDGTSSEVLLCNNGDTVLHAIIRTQDIGGTLQEQKEFSIGFLPDEIMISDPNRQQISLADYIGGRIDDRVGSYKAVVVTQSTGLTVFEADFSQHELKIILAQPNASTVVSALTIQAPDVPAGFAFVRHLIIKNEGNYTINFPSVILGKEINIEAGQKLDASYLFYRSGSTVTYDLTFNVV